MTNEEAIKKLTTTPVGDGTLDADLILALDIAVAAVGKQMPQKPLRKLFCEKCYSLMCPYCNELIIGCVYGDVAPRHCSNCGQALDWKEV